MNRRGQCRLDAPAGLQSAEDGRGATTEAPVPLGQGKRLAATRQHSVSGLLPGVFYRWRGERGSNRPAARDATTQRRGSYSDFGGPIGQHHRSTLERQDLVHASVPKLRRHQGPVAIVRRVGTVVVSSIDGVLWGWPRTHVGQEVFERVHPLVADRNAATSVVCIRGIARIQAALAKLLPASVFGSARPAVKRQCSRHGGFDSIASAA